MIHLLLTLFATSSWALGPIPNGHYGGSGEVNANCHNEAGEHFDYREEIAVQGNTLTVIAHYGGGRPDEIQTKRFTFSSNGYFTFSGEPTGKGEGFCGKLACHWNADFNGTKGEDTISFDSRGIWILGSALAQGKLWVCETYYDKKL